MREMLSALKPKEKLAIVLSMSGLALILASIMLAFSFCSSSRHEHKYDYRLQLEDGKFNLVGYCGIADCPSPDYVEKDVQGVTLVSAESPTCVKEGKRVYSYRKGNINAQYVEKISACPHTYADIAKNSDGHLVLKCTQAGCQSPVTMIANVESFEIDHYVDSDCFMPRQAVYNYVADGKSGSFVTLLDEIDPHTLGGKSAESLENADGTYTYGQPGINILDISGQASCGSLSNGYYVCEKCAQVVVVKVKKPGHKLVYSPSDIVAPTSLASGSVNASCSNADCDYTQNIVLPSVVIGENAEIIRPATEDSPMAVRYTYTHPLGCTVEIELTIGDPVVHNYVYELVLVPTGDGFGQFNLVGVCNDENCGEPTVTIEDVPVTSEDRSTCTKGEVVYSCEKDGHVYELVLPSMVTGDKHNLTYDHSQAVLPGLNSTGEIVISCQADDCGYTETVILPKIEFGVNAEVLFEYDVFTAYTYTYTTESGFVITLVVTL